MGFFFSFSFFSVYFLFLSLLVLKGYPTDIPALTAGAINPIGLSRIILIRYFDQPFLLSFTGARVQMYLASTAGFTSAILAGLIWLFGPLFLGLRSFMRKDY